jgi:hypothetical protein
MSACGGLRVEGPTMPRFLRWLADGAGFLLLLLLTSFDEDAGGGGGCGREERELTSNDV